MKFPYAVIPLGILSLYLYLFSSSLVNAGILNRKAHRLVWNYILMITFLVSALSGLFIALQINYKWEFTWIDPFLKWHVDFGIALSFTGFFHFLWHWTYYIKPKTKSVPRPFRDIPEGLPPVPLTELFHLGFVTLTTQVIFLRVSLNLFEGNELVTGIILSLWMLFTGAGALAGKWSYRPLSRKYPGIRGMAVTGSLPVVMLFSVYMVKVLFFPYGTSPDIQSTFLITALILLPFCFISGLYFTVYASRISGSGSDAAGKAYFVESSGSLAAGIFTGFLSVYILSLVQTALFLLLITLLLILWKFPLKLVQKGFIILFGAALILVFTVFAETFPERMIYRAQKILKMKQTPYGQIVVTETSGQINLFENNLLLFSGEDVIHAEEAVHYPLCQIRNTDTLLLISGGYKGMLTEMLKYKPELIEYTETDPTLIEMARMFADSINIPEDKRIRYILSTDGAGFLKNSPHSYDAVLVNADAPFTLARNRYFSLEFIHLVKTHLKSGGILSLSLPTGYNYSNESARQLNSVLFNTMKQVFSHVMILQGQQNFFLASDSSLSANIPDLIEAKHIETTYVNRYYLSQEDLQMRTDLIVADLDSTAGINTINRPRAFFLALNYWTSMYGAGMKVLPLSFILIFLLFYILYMKNLALQNLYLAGFTTAGLEILLLFGVQTGIGSLYQYSALLLGIFMAGLAAGAWLGNRVTGYNADQKIIAADIILIVCAVLSSLVMYLFTFPGYLIMIYASLLILVSAGSGGFIFSVTSRLVEKPDREKIALLYSADIFGGATGALVITIGLLPMVGFQWSSFILAGLTGVTLVRWSMKRVK